MSLSCFKWNIAIGNIYSTLLVATLFSGFVSYGQEVSRKKSIELKRTNTPQSVNGISFSGYSDSPILLCVVKLESVNEDAYFSLNNSEKLTLAYGLSAWTKQRVIAFTGTQNQINKVLSSIMINPVDKAELIKINVSTAVNPDSYGYDLNDGHFYKTNAGVFDHNNKLAADKYKFSNVSYSIFIR